MTNSLSSQTFRMAVLSLERIGVDVDLILSELKISKITLSNPVGRISLEREARFWALARKYSSDEAFALKMVEKVPFGTYPLLEYFGASCESIYQALVFFCRYAQVVHGGWSPQLIRLDEFIGFSLGSTRASGESRFSTEFTLGVLANRLAQFSSEKLPLIKVNFRHEAPIDRTLYEEIFDCPVQFSQVEDSLILDQSIENISCKNHDSFMLGTLLSLVEKIFRKLPGKIENESAFLQKAKSVIKDEIHDGEPSMVSIANKMAVSTRTLQRRLEIENTTLTQVVSEVRRDWATELMGSQSLTNEEIALQVGYSTLSAFNRAFRKWHNMTPSEYRNLKR